MSTQIVLKCTKTIFFCYKLADKSTTRLIESLNKTTKTFIFPKASYEKYFNCNIVQWTICSKYPESASFDGVFWIFLRKFIGIIYCWYQKYINGAYIRVVLKDMSHQDWPKCFGCVLRNWKEWKIFPCCFLMTLCKLIMTVTFCFHCYGNCRRRAIRSSCVLFCG